MRHDLIDDYANRIARAIALIERCEDDTVPSLADLAEAAAFSPFHFHRVFRLMTGETVGAALRRIRLAKAISDLTDGTRTITQAVAGSGYASSQAFARAMRAATDASPGDFRKQPAAAAKLAERLRAAPSPDTPLGIEITALDPFEVVAFRRDGPYESLNNAYDTLFEGVFAQCDPEALQGIWGVPLDDPFSVKAEARRFDCALDVGGASVDDERLSLVTLGGGECLTCDHVGSYDDVHRAFDALYRYALSKGHDLAIAPPVVNYHNEPDEVPEAELRATLYLPIVRQPA